MILIVEDDLMNREALANVLTIQGLKVGTAATGHQAIEKIHQTPTSCLVLDLNIPVMDGYAILGLLRADPDPWIASTPVIVTTGVDLDTDERNKLEVLGVKEVFRKPYEVSQLVEAITQNRRPVAAGQR